MNLGAPGALVTAISLILILIVGVLNEQNSDNAIVGQRGDITCTNNTHKSGKRAMKTLTMVGDGGLVG